MLIVSHCLWITMKINVLAMIICISAMSYFSLVRNGSNYDRIGKELKLKRSLYWQNPQYLNWWC